MSMIDFVSNELDCSATFALINGTLNKLCHQFPDSGNRSQPRGCARKDSPWMYCFLQCSTIIGVIKKITIVEQSVVTTCLVGYCRCTTSYVSVNCW